LSAIGRARETLGRPLLLAHRGAHDETIRENSLEALVAGAAKCDGVEFDVRFSADGTAVIVHDATLNRIFNLPRQVRELTSRELMEIGVPTLASALAAMPALTLIDLELKEAPTDDLFTTLHAARGPGAQGVVISSFDPGILYAVEKRMPGWARWLNAETLEAADRAAELSCGGVSVSIDLLSDEHIDRWVSRGLEVAGWTVRDRTGADVARDARLVALCVEGDGIRAAEALAR
jgi:glycerophosphoryl diester phosphodiesterase